MLAPQVSQEFIYYIQGNALNENEELSNIAKKHINYSLDFLIKLYE